VLQDSSRRTAARTLSTRNGFGSATATSSWSSPERVLAITCRPDPVTVAFQQLDQEFPDGAVIVDDEQSPGGAEERRRLRDVGKFRHPEPLPIARA
jgi:hypothetical protein